MADVISIRFPPGLYGITPDWLDTDRMLDAVRHAAKGGMTSLQWRRKSGTPGERMAQGRALRDLCSSLGVTFIVNDSLETAVALEADGLHMGREDGSLSEARRVLGKDRLLGASCYNQIMLAQRALDAGVDYVAFGAVYPSATKPDAVQATTEHLSAAHQLVLQTATTTRAAVVAIGGITPDNALPLINAGADCLAVISSLFDTPDIQGAASRYAGLFGAP